MRILLVDSPGLDTRTLAPVLRASGLEVEEAPDAQTALWRIAGGSFRTVLLDIGAGRLAWDVVAAALWSRPPARVIAVTEAPIDPVLRRRAYGAGVWELIGLPGPTDRHLETVVDAAQRALGASRGRAVLFVDECAGITEGIGALITDEGYHVESAATTDDAMRMMREREYALILTETRRIGSDGFAVLKQAPRLQPGVPVVVLTARSDDETFLRSVELGAHACLWKLAEPEEIIRAIDTAIGIGTVRGSRSFQEE